MHKTIQWAYRTVEAVLMELTMIVSGTQKFAKEIHHEYQNSAVCCDMKTGAKKDIMKRNVCCPF